MTLRKSASTSSSLSVRTTAGSAKSRIGTRRDFRIRGKRRCSALDVTTLPSIVSEYHRRLSSSFGSRRLRPLSSPACPQVIVYVNGAGLRRSRATTATRRASRSPRSPAGSDAPKPPSRPISTIPPGRRPGRSRRATWACAVAAAPVREVDTKRRLADRLLVIGCARQSRGPSGRLHKDAARSAFAKIRRFGRSVARS